MKEFIIEKNEAGQRFDKYLNKLFCKGSMSFIFKMLRKKNFVLNDKKATGKEILKLGDHVKLYISDDTFSMFTMGETGEMEEISETCLLDREGLIKKGIAIIYEDGDVILLCKPTGVLSQKSKPEDISMNEYLIGYLLKTGQLTKAQMKTFKPSIANRLDRNTSGIILCGKSLAGLQMLNEIIKNRDLEKYYKTVVVGEIQKDFLLEDSLTKDHQNNIVQIHKGKENEKKEESVFIKTGIHPLSYFTFNGMKYTEIEVHLYTGKTHQIRAHLASINHPLVGDHKYGNGMDPLSKVGKIPYQMLHAHRIVFPKLDGEFEYLSEKEFKAEPSREYVKMKRLLTK